MAITRRQFVTTLGALAAAMGVGQADISKITEAFAHKAGSPWGSGWASKPKVIWVHGAECTGCSTSLLSLFEDARGLAIEGTSITTKYALDAVAGQDIVSGTANGHPNAHRTLYNSKALTGCDFDNDANSTAYAVNIADVLIDFIDLQYHETVMGMGGDLAYQWLADNMAGSAAPFVLVVEGAVQDKANGGYWNVTGAAPWCSIGMGDASGELSFDDVVEDLAGQGACKAVVAIGQCATYGGYPAAVSPVLGAAQTGAQGVKAFLGNHGGASVQGKVINVPGCPANPWWFVLTVVAWMVDATAILAGGGTGATVLGILKGGADGLAINPDAVDSMGRLKAVFSTPIHGPNCPRYQDYLNGKFCTHPGTAPAGAVAGGCLQLIGCKGPSAKSLCNVHGWNAQQPRNDATWAAGIQTISGGTGSACPMAGAPCMACSEQGYPDAFVPFVAR